jgi:hypothetical protein
VFQRDAVGRSRKEDDGPDPRGRAVGGEHGGRVLRGPAPDAGDGARERRVAEMVDLDDEHGQAKAVSDAWEMPQCLAQRSSFILPRCLPPRRSAKKRLELPSKREIILARDVRGGGADGPSCRPASLECMKRDSDSKRQAERAGVIRPPPVAVHES